MTYSDELRSTPEGRRLREQERLILEVTEAISRLMEAGRISKAQLAARLGSSQPFITKLLSGSNNFTLRTMSDVFFHLGWSAHVEVGAIGAALTLPSEEAGRSTAPVKPVWIASRVAPSRGRREKPIGLRVGLRAPAGQGIAA